MVKQRQNHRTTDDLNSVKIIELMVKCQNYHTTDGKTAQCAQISML